ncbi:MAG: TRAP transporter small permease protein [Rhodobacterales bacterium 65-51]|jgi:TRAP-type C4-dicarboxylate transport system permease small subunit|uniref:TRAP transporter small permease n=1 Tax=uncultured Gemmobacter sp. TaxID=1095917 RepID=UPI00095B4749|nr:TRAP transporter small permease [uncultured Gemmobacter sp.]OJY35219.1 MAG: TRAP transporter small permease protein [Rhodobacterales bacterium 65-51]
MLKAFTSAGEAAVRLTHNAAALLLAIATLLVFVQVVTRFVLGDAAVWSELVARGAIIWSTFLVAGAAFRAGTMIPIDFIRSLLPAPIQLWVVRLVTLLTLIFLGVLVWYGILMAGRAQGQRVAMLDVSMAVFYAAIPFGALCAIPGVLLRHRDAERGSLHDEEIHE